MKKILVLFIFMGLECGLLFAQNYKGHSASVADSSYSKRNPTTTVRLFYEWYINDVYTKKDSSYQPRIVNIGDRKYALDTSYFINLRSSGFFSDNFITAELDKINSCNQEMYKINFEEEPEAYFETNKCKFLWYYEWVGGQGEEISAFRVIRVRGTSEKECIVEGHSMLTSGGKYIDFLIHLSLNANIWKIDMIEMKE